MQNYNEEIANTRAKIEAEERKIEVEERKIEELEEELAALKQQLKEAPQDQKEFIQKMISETNSSLTAKQNSLAASKNILTELYRRLPSSPGKILIFLIFSQIFIQSKSMCFSISYLFVSIDTKAVAVMQVLFTYFL